MEQREIDIDSMYRVCRVKELVTIVQEDHVAFCPAEPGYYCVEPGRTDLHFSTAGRVKQTLTLPSD